MSKSGTEKVRIFKENKRVKVKTIHGEKLIGRFKIIDEQTIEIEGYVIPLNTISNLKSRSVVAGIIGTVLIIAGAYLAVISPFVAVAVALSGSGSSVGSILLIGGFAMTYSGIFFNEFARNYRLKNNWTYNIIEIDKR